MQIDIERAFTLVRGNGQHLGVFRLKWPANFQRPGVVLVNGATFAWRNGWTYHEVPHIQLIENTIPALDTLKTDAPAGSLVQ